MIRERLTELVTGWGGDVSILLDELEEKRARLQELEAASANQSDEVKALNRRVEAQESLIESLRREADETATLRREIHDKNLELEKKRSDIGSKHELIDALRRDAEGIGRLKGDSRVKDQEIARLTREKQQALQHAAEITGKFKILTAATLTGIDTAVELEAIRAELDARKSLIESLRGDAERAADLETQLEEKRFVISTLETTIDRHVSSIAELQKSVAASKAQYAALKLNDSSPASAIAAALPELTDADLQAEEVVEDVSGDLKDPTTPVDMRESLLAAEQTARMKK